MKILRLPEVSEMTGLSRSSIFRLIETGQFPGSVRLTQRAIGWHAEDVRSWIEQRPHAQKKGED